MSKTNVVEISHEPFGRFSVVRRVHTDLVSCDYCGGYRLRQGQEQKPFEYGTESDSRPGRPSWDDRVFCCLACRQAYYGE